MPVNIGQITVNVNDIIPPDNFATVDTGSKIGSVYTKEQDNAWRKEVEENTTSGIKGIAKPDDTIVTTGFYRMLANTADTYTNYLDHNNAPIIVTADDLNILNAVQRNEVIIEVNNGVSEKKVFAKVGADGANGTATIPTWVAGDYSPDAIVIKDFVQYITPNGASSTDIPTEDSIVWKSLGSNLKLDEAGGALGYDKFLEMSSGQVGEEIVEELTSVIFNISEYYGDVGGWGFHFGNYEKRTDYIYLQAGCTATIKAISNHATLVPLFAVFNSDKSSVLTRVFPTQLSVVQSNDYTATENCYIVANCTNLSLLQNCGIIREVFSSGKPSRILSDANLSDFGDRIASSIEIINLKDAIIHKDAVNIFDSSQMIPDSYINGSGVVTSNSTTSYNAFFIPVSPLTEYLTDIPVIAYTVAMYDINKTFLGFIAIQPGKFTTPANCAYIRYNIVITNTLPTFIKKSIPTTDEGYVTFPKLRVNADQILGGNVDVLAGKKIGVLGDSISAGSLDIGGKYWTQLLIENEGVVMHNYAANGAQYSEVYNQAVSAKNSGTEFDYIIVFASTNDFGYDIPMGEFWTESGTTVKTRTLNLSNSNFKGRLNRVFQYLKANFPKTQILVCNSLHRGVFQTMPNENTSNNAGFYLSEYSEAIEKASLFYSMPIIDVRSETNLYPIAELQEYYKASDDFLHLSYKGQYRLYKVIESNLKKLAIKIDE